MGEHAIGGAPVWLFRQCEFKTRNVCLQVDLVFVVEDTTASSWEKHFSSHKNITSFPVSILCPVILSCLLSPALWTDFGLVLMEQKVVLITGCSSGIGLSLAIHLASDSSKTYKGKHYAEWVLVLCACIWWFVCCSAWLLDGTAIWIKAFCSMDVV